MCQSHSVMFCVCMVVSGTDSLMFIDEIKTCGENPISVLNSSQQLELVSWVNNEIKHAETQYKLIIEEMSNLFLPSLIFYCFLFCY